MKSRKRVQHPARGMIASGSEVVNVVTAEVAATSGVPTAACGSVCDWA